MESVQDVSYDAIYNVLVNDNLTADDMILLYQDDKPSGFLSLNRVTTLDRLVLNSYLYVNCNHVFFSFIILFFSIIIFPLSNNGSTVWMLI